MPGDWLGLQALAEREAVRKAQQETATQGIPPLPNVMPEVTPVAALKNRTARDQQYSDKAREELFKQHVKVLYRPYEEGKDNRLGYYLPHDPTRFDKVNRALQKVAPIKSDVVVGPMVEGYSPESILAHEFAHKWNREQLPTSRWEEWKTEWPTTATNNPEAGNMLVRTLERTGGPLGWAQESYAHNTEAGPNYIPPEVRGYFYPGLYRDNVQPDVAYNAPRPEAPTLPTGGNLDAPPLPGVEPVSPGQYAGEYWTAQDLPRPLTYRQSEAIGPQVPSNPNSYNWNPYYDRWKPLSERPAG